MSHLFRFFRKTPAASRARRLSSNVLRGLERLESRTLLSGLSAVPAEYLHTDVSSNTAGLVGTYFNQGLRRTDAIDWRTIPRNNASGTRVDAQLSFTTDAWGSRSTVGLTRGSDANWEDFSVQWDGAISIPNDGVARYLYLTSDDGSRLWIDYNRNGAFESNEMLDNNWGNPQGLRTSLPSVPLPGGTYRIRVQYEEVAAGNRLQLQVSNRAEVDGLTVVPASLLSRDAQGTQPGLAGSYFNRNLRGSTNVDWRVGEGAFGSRVDPLLAFAIDGWGRRFDVGLTGGTDKGWDNFSAQWDGYLKVPENGMQVYLRSDDSSRILIDVNGNGAFSDSRDILLNNSWGSGTLLQTSAPTSSLAKGVYRIRVQYEEGSGDNQLFLLMAPRAPTNLRVGSVGAQAIAIDNPSFESQVLSDGAWRGVPITGWTTTGSGESAGPQNWTDAQYVGANDGDQILSAVPDGRNSAYSRGGNISQLLNATLIPNSHYTLSVEVGRRLDGQFPAWYRVQLVAGGEVLAEEFATNAPVAGQWRTSIVSFVTGASHPRLGQRLEIRILTANDTTGNGGMQANYDNVRLIATTTSSTVTVTVPATANPYRASSLNGAGSDPFDGTVPPSIPVVPGQVLQITATGQARRDSSFPFSPPDGAEFATARHGSLGGISGWNLPIDALGGVFLGSTIATAPQPSTAATSYQTINPLVGQVFYIGDGLTGAGSGIRQTIVVPAGATRLFLATLDGYNWANNGGAFTVTVAPVSASAPSVSLNWDPTISVGEYYVERANSAAGPFKQIAILAANTTQYVDAGNHLEVPTSFYYRVRADSGGISSAYSQTGSVTLPRPRADSEGPRVLTSATAPSGLPSLGTYSRSADFVDLTFTEPINLESLRRGVTLTRDGATISITDVVQQQGSTYRLHFPRQTQPGEYRVLVDYFVMDLAGNPMNQNPPKPNGESIADRFLGAFILQADAQRPTVTLTTPNSGSFRIGDIVRIEAQVDNPANVSHVWIQLYKGGERRGQMYGNIHQFPVGSGNQTAYTWTIGSTLEGRPIESGTDYKIKWVAFFTDGQQAVGDFSDGFISVDRPEVPNSAWLSGLPISNKLTGTLFGVNWDDRNVTDSCVIAARNFVEAHPELYGSGATLPRLGSDTATNFNGAARFMRSGVSLGREYSEVAVPGFSKYYWRESDNSLPPIGAVIVWDVTVGEGFGHIGIVTNVDSSTRSVVVLDGNWFKEGTPRLGVGAIHMVRISTHVLGWMIPTLSQ